MIKSRKIVIIIIAYKCPFYLCVFWILIWSEFISLWTLHIWQRRLKRNTQEEEEEYLMAKLGNIGEFCSDREGWYSYTERLESYFTSLWWSTPATAVPFQTGTLQLLQKEGPYIAKVCLSRKKNSDQTTTYPTHHIEQVASTEEPVLHPFQCYIRQVKTNTSHCKVERDWNSDGSRYRGCRVSTF